MMNTSKAAIVASAALGKVASVFGYAVGGLSLLVIAVGFTELETEGVVGAMILCALLLAFCLFCVVRGAQIKRRIARFRQYVSLMSAQHMFSINSIAASTGKSVDFVRADLKQMIARRFFVSASLDDAAQAIHIGGKPPVPLVPEQAPSVQTEYVPYRCSGCGAADVKPKGVPAQCEYCGSTTV